MRHGARAWLAAGALGLAGCGGEPQTIPERAPPVSPPAETWDLGRLPPAEPVLETRQTPEGVRILILERGEGPESTDATPLDVSFTEYLLTGQQVERGILPLGGPGRFSSQRLLRGLRIGLAGLRHGERRRLLVPAALAHGWDNPSKAVPPGSDLVFDVKASTFAVLDLVTGTGAEAKAGQRVLAHYVGMFPDGQVFEDSRKLRNGEPASLPLREGQDGVISGWVRGVPGMKVGGRRRLRVPSTLGYGRTGNLDAKGNPGKIPPNADLVFVIDLVDVMPADVPPR
jgi:FKBP-type peptidyl-prolyl cis-trans isomerase